MDNMNVVIKPPQSLLYHVESFQQPRSQVSSCCDECLISSSEQVLKRCSQCKEVEYCSKKCQSRAWKQGHKISCGKICIRPVPGKGEWKSGSCACVTFQWTDTSRQVKHVFWSWNLIECLAVLRFTNFIRPIENWTSQWTSLGAVLRESLFYKKSLFSGPYSNQYDGTENNWFDYHIYI